jgi:hypothetical protein
MNSFLDALYQQQLGQFHYALLIVLATAIWLVIYKKLRAQHRWKFVLLSLAAFALLWVVSLRDYLSYLPALAFAGLVAWTWKGYARYKIPDWLVITAPALLLRLPHLFDSLWYDETFTAALAQLPFDRMNVVNLYDVHPPIWYAISWLNVRLFGSSELALRLPALLFGLCACWLVYKFALHVGYRRHALMAGLIAAALPSQIYYSTEARGYTLLVCLVLALMLAVIERKPGRFVLLSYLVPMTHSLGLFYLPIIGGWALLTGHLKFRTLALAATAAVPALGLAALQSGDVADGFWLGGLHLPGLVEPFFRMTMMNVPTNLVFIVAAAIVALTGLALFANRRVSFRSPLGLVLIVLAGVPALLGGVSLAWHNVYLDRAMLPAMTMLPILWSTLFSRPTGQGNIARWVALPTLLIAGALTFSSKSDATPITRACENADSVYTTSISAAFIAEYYTDAPIILWTDAGDLNQSLPPVATEALGWERRDFYDLPVGRYCIIDGSTPLSRPDERAYMSRIASIASSSTLVNENSFGTVYIHRLTIGGA